MKKLLLISIIFALIIVGIIIVAAGNKISLQEYKEECLAYNYNITYEIHCRCNSTVYYMMFCNWECCNCPEKYKEYYTQPITVFSDECAKYHLVRYV